jgi:hypothetical protein
MLFERCIRLGLLLVIPPSYVLAQESSPKLQIVGEVLDVSGAAIADATVQVQGISAPTKLSANTNQAGQFRPLLESGKYDITIMRSGFKTLTQQVEVTSVGEQRFSFVLEIDSRNSGYQGPCCFQNQPVFQPEMSELPHQLVPPPSVSLLPLIPPRAHSRNPIARFFSAIGRQLGF